MNHKISQLIKFFLGWPLTIAALFFIFKYIYPNLSSILSALRSMNWILFVLGIIGIIIYFFIRCYFWQQLLAQHKINLSLKETTWLWGSAELRRYIPGNIWTVLGRTSNFSQKNISRNTVLITFFQEAEFIVVSGLFVSLWCVNFFVYGLLPNFPWRHLVANLIPIISFACIVLFLANTYWVKKIPLPKNLQKLTNRLLPHFPIRTNFFLFVIQSAALFFFGVGTYFTISSLKLLYVHDITTFIGFFVFSLLFGYLSFITPMGLGVREGMITAGLMKFIPLALAGFSAIFARVVFIFSELCFLLISYLAYKGKYSFVKKATKFLKNYWPELLLGTSIVLFILYMLAATFLRYDNFYTGRFDLGNMDQTVWNTVHGRIFQQTDANGTDIVSRLSFHADFILILLAPFYWLWQDPKMLLLIQTVVLAGGAVFIYLIAKKEVPRITALVFACVYLINPSMNDSNLYDFHGVVLATTFLLGAFYFLKNNRYVWYIVFLVLAGITKEEVWIIIAMFGIYTFLRKNNKILFNRILGAFITLLSLAIGYYLIEHAIPSARGSAHFALAFFSDLGSSPVGIVRSILVHPIKTGFILLQPPQLTYLFQIFFPLGFFSLLSPLYLLLAIPDLTIDLLSSSATWHQIYYQYTASITPFVFISALYGYKMFVKRFPKLTKPALYYVVLVTFISAASFGPLPGSSSANLSMFDSPLPYANIINDFLTNIPRRYSIAATNNLGSHLSHRQKIFTVPVGIDQADIIAFLLNDPGAQPSLAAQKKMAENMKKDKNYIEVFKQGDFVVFEKRNLYTQKEPNVTRIKLFPLSIPALQHRDYIGGDVTLEKKLNQTSFSTTYLISYDSDGLKQYALSSIPRQEVPKKGFPILILNHDYYPDNTYDTEMSDIALVDYFTQKGFLVIKPDYRGYGQSETDTPPLEPLGYSVDVLNLITSLKTYYPADTSNVSLWGQGLGGEVTLKVLETVGENEDKTLLNSLKGAVIWGPVIDPSQWPSTSLENPITKNFGNQQDNPIFWQSISVRNYIDDIHTPLEIDQGTSDAEIPYTSSIELYDDLVSFNKNAKLRIFPDDTHQLSLYHYQALSGDDEFFKSHIE